VTNYLLRARLRGALDVRRIPDGGHIVVCGLSPVGFRVVEELVQVGQRPVVIELSQDNRFVTTARRLGAAVIIGDMTVAEDFRLLPLALLPAHGSHSDAPLTARLGSGDRLAAIIALPDLDSLLRRRPARGSIGETPRAG